MTGTMQDIGDRYSESEHFHNHASYAYKNVLLHVVLLCVDRYRSDGQSIRNRDWIVIYFKKVLHSDLEVHIETH